MRKTILYVHHCGVKSGACNSLIAIIKNLDNQKYKPVVLCPKGTAFEALSYVVDEIIEIPTPPELVTISGYPFNRLRLLYLIALLPRIITILNIINKISPDIIHFNELSLSPIVYFLKKKGFKVVTHARIVLNSNNVLINRLLILLLKRYCDHVFCIDGSVRKQLIKIKQASIVYNPYLFDTKQLEFKSKSKETFNVLFLSNLIYYKGIFDVMKSAIELRGDKSIQFFICGVNSRDELFFKTIKGRFLSFLNIVPNNEKKIRSIIDKNNLKNVKLMGHVSNIKDIILESSVLLFPSYMNGPPRSVFEAGVFGIPSIISMKDKVEDVVENNINAIIIDERSPSQITAAIKLLQEDNEFYVSLGKNASIKYKSLNNPTINLAKIEAVYDNLLNSN
jgi:glycosyltransferase involved in cell wall biosynthesis